MGKLLSMLQCLVYIHPFFFNCSSLCSHDVLYHTWKHLLVARNCLLFLSLCLTWFRQGRLRVPPEKEGYCGQELKPGSEDCWKGCQAPETHYPLLLHFSTSMHSLPSTKCSFAPCWWWWHTIVFLPNCNSENVEKCGQSAVTRSWNQKSLILLVVVIMVPNWNGLFLDCAEVLTILQPNIISCIHVLQIYFTSFHCHLTCLFLLVLCLSSASMKPFVIKVLQLHVF
jgi:hypothetical protein